MIFYKSILLTALLVQWLLFRKREAALPLFLPFLIIVNVFEWPVDYVIENITGSNYISLNLFSKLCTYYYLYVFLAYFRERSWAKLYNIIFYLYLGITLVIYFATWRSDRLDTLSYILGMTLLLPLLLRYLYEKVYIEAYADLRDDPHLYLAFGILIFFTSSFPILIFINTLITFNPAFEAYTVLVNIGNIFLSLAYLGVALCSKIPQPSTRSY